MYICMYIHTHIKYMHAYIHVFSAYKYTNINICIHIYFVLCVYVLAYTHISMYVPTYMYTYVTRVWSFRQ